MKRTLRPARRLLVGVAFMSLLVAPGFGQQPAFIGIATNTPGSQAAWVTTGSLGLERSGHTATLLSNGKVLVLGGEYFDEYWTGASTSADVYDPVAGVWTWIEIPLGLRWGYTATGLADGRILIAGGIHGVAEGSQLVAGAELYNPTTGVWSAAGNMQSPRIGHTATRLADGRVLVAGGRTQGYVDLAASAEVYDPASGSWTATGALNQVRSAHTATLLRDGKVLVLGGWVKEQYVRFASTFDSAELYDPLKGTWTPASPLNSSRALHAATLLTNGKVLITGGYTVSSENGVMFPKSLVGTELFDPATGISTVTGDLNTARASATATLLPDGDVLVVGGLLYSAGNDGIVSRSDVPSAERFHEKSAQWRNAGELGTPRHDHTATLLQDGRVLIAGGSPMVAQYVGQWALNSAELFGNFPPGTIGPGYTGAWFDPAQGGHGLIVEVLTDNRFLAGWFAFNPAGTEQAWFVGTGTYSGNTATINSVVQPTGGRWIPNFDPSRIVNNAWGTLKFTFTDCNHGKVEFASTLGYGTGSMNLARLTQPAGLTCP